MDVVMSRDELAHARSDLEASIDRKRDHTHEDRPFERMQPELERRGNAEIRASAAQTPEQVRILLVGSADLLAVRGDEIDREQVVDCQAVLALESAHAAAQRQAGDTRVAD